QGCKGCLDLALAADIEIEELLADCLRRGLHLTSIRLGIGNVRIHEVGNCRRFGHELVQQLQSLRRQQNGEKAHARDVAARPIEAGDKAELDWVAAGCKDDWPLRGCCLGRQCRSSAAGSNHGHLTMNQIGRHRREPITSAFRPTYSIATFWPSMKPASFKPWRNAVTR